MSKKYTKWKRLNFHPLGQQEIIPPNRASCEHETNQDVQKPIQQLICDVHEETTNGDRPPTENLNHALKRFASMTGRVALEHEKTSARLLYLTWAIGILTLALVALTVVIIRMGK